MRNVAIVIDLSGTTNLKVVSAINTLLQSVPLCNLYRLDRFYLSKTCYRLKHVVSKAGNASISALFCKICETYNS